MKNSPTICQNFVASTFHVLPSSCKYIHYMGDILVAHPSPSELKVLLHYLISSLQSLNLHISPDKVQLTQPYQFLSFHMSKSIKPLNPHIHLKDKYSLDDLQKLCGNVNWLKPFLSIPPAIFKPLFSLLKGRGS